MMSLHFLLFLFLLSAHPLRLSFPFGFRLPRKVFIISPHDLPSCSPLGTPSTVYILLNPLHLRSHTILIRSLFAPPLEKTEPRVETPLDRPGEKCQDTTSNYSYATVPINFVSGSHCNCSSTLEHSIPFRTLLGVGLFIWLWQLWPIPGIRLIYALS